MPSVEAEDARQFTREIATVQTDQIRLRNRIHGLLATQGVRLALNGAFETALATVRTGDGRAFPEALRVRILHEWTALQTLEVRAASEDRSARCPEAVGAVAAVGTRRRHAAELRQVGREEGGREEGRKERITTSQAPLLCCSRVARREQQTIGCWGSVFLPFLSSSPTPVKVLIAGFDCSFSSTRPSARECLAPPAQGRP